MAYKTTLTKVVSFITLLTFLSTNSIYAAPDFKSNFKLRVPVSINKDRIDDGLTANGVRKRETFPVKMVDEKGRPIITLIKTPSEIDPEAIAAQRKLFEKEFLEAGSRANFTAGMAYKKLGTLKPN